MFLVAAIAIFALTPLGFTLGQGVEHLDRTGLVWARAHSAAWAWTTLELPFVSRPLWLVPACLGLVCAGLAGSLGFRSTATRRRRS